MPLPRLAARPGRGEPPARPPVVRARTARGPLLNERAACSAACARAREGNWGGGGGVWFECPRSGFFVVGEGERKARRCLSPRLRPPPPAPAPARARRPVPRAATIGSPATVRAHPRAIAAGRKRARPGGAGDAGSRSLAPQPQGGMREKKKNHGNRRGPARARPRAPGARRRARPIEREQAQPASARARPGRRGAGRGGG